MNSRILLLRTFSDYREDFYDLALLAKVCGKFGKLILVGDKNKNLDLEKNLLATQVIDSLEVNQNIQFITASSDSWKRTIIEQILCADVIIIRFTPKSLDFPKLVTPKPVDSYFEYYKLAPQEPQTGAGLLSEVMYCQRLNAIKKCLLIVNEWQLDDLGKVLKQVVMGPGDIFKFDSRGMIPQRPRFTALDFGLSSLQEIEHAMAFPKRDILFTNHEYISMVAGKLINHIKDIMNSNNPKQGLNQRIEEGYLDFGVSKLPKKVFPDYELKVIRYTPVENLIAMSPGHLIEIDYKNVIRDYGLEYQNAVCPYCKAEKSFLFFYQYGHIESRGEPIRCKCQYCSRRSTVEDGILMDQ